MSIPKLGTLDFVVRSSFSKKQKRTNIDVLILFLSDFIYNLK